MCTGDAISGSGMCTGAISIGSDMGPGGAIIGCTCAGGIACSRHKVRHRLGMRKVPVSVAAPVEGVTAKAFRATGEAEPEE